MRKKLALLASVVAILLSAHSPGLAADVIKLKFANYFPPTHMNSVIMDELCKEVNQKLAGKVEVTHYPGGTLLTAPKMAAGVSVGIADIGLAHINYTRGRFPVMEIMGLPLGFPSSWVSSHVANDLYEKFKPKEWDDYRPLMFSTSAPTIFMTLNKPVKTLEDLQGMKIRATGRLTDIVKSLGGTPMPIEMVDLYESLRRGVIEGGLGPAEQMKGWKTGELVKYATPSWKVGSTDPFYVVMNKRKWDSLPADVQKVLDEIGNEYKDKWGASWNKIDIEGLEFLKQQGGEVVPFSEAESERWVKATEPVIEDFKKDLAGKGYQAQEIEGWLSFIKERIGYWKAQEKERKIPTAYQY